MSNPIAAWIESRASTNRFDPSHALSDAQITELIRLATRAPSCYNLQNWRFVAVRTPQAKARLQALAYGQRQVADAAVTFIVCGTLRAHEHLLQVLRPSVDAAIMDQRTVDGWVAMAAKSHEGNAELQRDEAVRSASLAAMTLMFAAGGMGLSSGPMTGFDAAGVSAAFGLSPTELPVLLVTVGRGAPGNWPQKPRKPVDEVIEFV